MRLSWVDVTGNKAGEKKRDDAAPAGWHHYRCIFRGVKSDATRAFPDLPAHGIIDENRPFVQHFTSRGAHGSRSLSAAARKGKPTRMATPGETL